MALPTELVRFLYAVWFQEPMKSPDQYPAVLGVAISQFLQWDIEAVVRTCSEALEDSKTAPAISRRGPPEALKET